MIIKIKNITHAPIHIGDNINHQDQSITFNNLSAINKIVNKAINRLEPLIEKLKFVLLPILSTPFYMIFYTIIIYRKLVYYLK